MTPPGDKTKAGFLSSKTEFMYPQTRQGKANYLDLLTEPSHKIASDSLIVAFEADPDVVREYVPEPLELDGSGLCYLWTLEGSVFTDRHSTEFISQERTQYCEAMFWIPCDYEGERYHFLPFSWVNRDWLAYMVRQMGLPHKIADVQMTRFHPAHQTYDAPHEGARVSVGVNCYGEVLKAHCDLERVYQLDELPFKISNDYCPKFLGHRFFWDACENRPAVNDLVAHWADSMTLGPVWGGPADVTFFDAENEEVLPFKPRRVVGGWWFTLAYDHSTTPPEVVYRFED